MLESKDWSGWWGGRAGGEKESKGGRACVNPLYVLRQPRAGGTVIFGLWARTSEGRGRRAACPKARELHRNGLPYFSSQHARNYSAAYPCTVRRFPITAQKTARITSRSISLRGPEHWCSRLCPLGCIHPARKCRTCAGSRARRREKRIKN